MSGDRWVVMCRVSGGVTGTRESPMRDRNGVVRFETFEEAEARARELSSIQHRFSTASFQYWAERS